MKPLMKRLTTLAAATFVAASFTAPTQAADWPARPVEILVPSSPGRAFLPMLPKNIWTSLSS